MSAKVKPRVEMLGYRSYETGRAVVIGVRAAVGGSGFEGDAVLEWVKKFTQKSEGTLDRPK